MDSAEVPVGQRAGRDRKGKPQRGTRKQQGELAIRFMLTAAGNGFGVAKPWEHSERYDYILDSGKCLWRVQVKSTNNVGCTHRYTIDATGGSTGKKKPYTAKQIDVLVVYIVAEDAWYVIPIATFAPRLCLMFYPSGSKKGGL